MLPLGNDTGQDSGCEPRVWTLLCLCMMPVQLQRSKHQLMQYLPFHFPTVPLSPAAVGSSCGCHTVSWEKPLLWMKKTCFTKALTSAFLIESLTEGKENGWNRSPAMDQKCQLIPELWQCFRSNYCLCLNQSCAHKNHHPYQGRSLKPVGWNREFTKTPF